MMNEKAALELLLPDVAATELLGARLARCVNSKNFLLFLHGNLGAGKTSLVRGYLRALGYEGAVKSPTYTLVEAYGPGSNMVYHFDLYRLGDAEELEYLGFRDYLDEDGQCLIEWPEQGEGYLPVADLAIHLDYHGEARSARLQAVTDRGKSVLECCRL